MKRKIVSILMMTLMIITFFGNVSVSNAQSPPLTIYLYGGEIIVDGHESGENTVIITPYDQLGVDIGDTENLIIIDVDYIIDCPGSADDGKAEIEFGDGSDIDYKWSGTYASGQLHIGKLIDPGETFSVRLYGFYKDWWGVLIDEDTVYMYGSTRPGSPSNLNANPSYYSIDLSWTKGNGGEKTMIRRSTSGYPSSPGSGDQVYFNTGTSTTDSGLNHGTTYYYSAWSYDTDGGTYSNNHDEISATTLNHPPDTPSKPSGPTTGYRNTPYTYSTSTTDPDGDQIKYGFDWNGDYTADDWTGFYNSGQQATKTHSFTNIGTYPVQVIAEDSLEEQSPWSNYLNVNIVNQAPSTPTVTGPSSGYVGDLLTYCATATDPDGDDIKYGFDWDDGDPVEWTGFYNSGTEICKDHSWGTPGTYNIEITAEDTYGAQSSNVISVTIQGANNPPNTPNTPYGPTEGEVGETLTFCTVTTDPDGNNVRYGWDWNGDYTEDEWVGPYSSGEEVCTPHYWSSPGEYYVRVKAKDIHGASSGWSQALIVEITGPPPKADLEVDGSLHWTDVSPGQEVIGCFEVYNDGDAGTLLDWEIVEYPEWGTWTFTPSSGDDLTPEEGGISVECMVIAPGENQQTFIGSIKVVNTENPDGDIEWVDVSLATPRSRFLFRNVFNQFLLRLFDQFPFLEQILGL